MIEASSGSNDHSFISFLEQELWNYIQKDLGWKTFLTESSYQTAYPEKKFFTSSAKVWLEKNGYEIAQISGLSLIDLQLKLFRSKEHLASIEIIPQIGGHILSNKLNETQVAFNRKKLIMPESAGKNLVTQQKMLVSYSDSLQLPDSLCMKMAPASIYVELIMHDLQKKRQNILFGKSYGSFATRTTSQLEDLSSLIVQFDRERVIKIGKTRDSNNNPNVGLAPLIFPR